MCKSYVHYIVQSHCSHWKQSWGLPGFHAGRLESASTTGFRQIKMKGLMNTRTAQKLPPVQTRTARSPMLFQNFSASNSSQYISWEQWAAVGFGGLQNTVGQKVCTCSFFPPCCCVDILDTVIATQLSGVPCHVLSARSRSRCRGPSQKALN